MDQKNERSAALWAAIEGLTDLIDEVHEARLTDVSYDPIGYQVHRLSYRLRSGKVDPSSIPADILETAVTGTMIDILNTLGMYEVSKALQNYLSGDQP